MRCIHAGGKGRRTSSKWARAITASRSGLGMPFRPVLPSAASPNIVSISRSNCSAGRTSHTKCASSSPAFQNLCAVPAGTVSLWPGPATISSRPRRKPTVPRSTWKRSSWYGCRWAAATNPFGLTKVSITIASPFVSREVLRKTSRSPVTGFSMTSPALIMQLLLSSRLKLRRSEGALTGRLRQAGAMEERRADRLEFRLLGPLEVEQNGRVLAVGGRRQRALLTVLLLHANTVVPRDRLIDALWGESPPETAANALQVAVHALRKLLGADRIVTRGRGYLLCVEAGSAVTASSCPSWTHSLPHTPIANGCAASTCSRSIGRGARRRRWRSTRRPAGPSSGSSESNRVTSCRRSNRRSCARMRRSHYPRHV